MVVGLVQDVETPVGLARVRISAGAAGTLVLGHGAGGGVSARDLQAAADAARAREFSVVLVEQPYRVAGRRSPAPARQLDVAWVAVVASLDLSGPLIVGGRSSGARVACRTAAACGAAAVLCLAFPLHPPGRPDKSRLDELDLVTVPTLVVQGESDPFGMPPAGRSRSVVRVPGNHSLSSSVGVVRDEVGAWLLSLGLNPAAVDHQRLAADRGRRV